jgi:hypothetical protein
MTRLRAEVERLKADRRALVERVWKPGPRLGQI